jgi:hypothetical protein
MSSATEVVFARSGVSGVSVKLKKEQQEASASASCWALAASVSSPVSTSRARRSDDRSTARSEEANHVSNSAIRRGCSTVGSVQESGTQSVPAAVIGTSMDRR